MSGGDILARSRADDTFAKNGGGKREEGRGKGGKAEGREGGRT